MKLQLALALSSLLSESCSGTSLNQLAVGSSKYSHFKQYSPFYLKHHPEARRAGDIVHIQTLSKERGQQGDLTGIENVFEKHLGSFETLLTAQSTGSQKESKNDLKIFDNEKPFEKPKPSFPQIQGSPTTSNTSTLHTTDLLQGEEDHVLVQVESGEKVLEELRAKLRSQAEAEVRQQAAAEKKEATLLQIGEDEEEGEEEAGEEGEEEAGNDEKEEAQPKKKAAVKKQAAAKKELAKSAPVKNTTTVAQAKAEVDDDEDDEPKPKKAKKTQIKASSKKKEAPKPAKKTEKEESLEQESTMEEEEGSSDDKPADKQHVSTGDMELQTIGFSDASDLTSLEVEAETMDDEENAKREAKLAQQKKIAEAKAKVEAEKRKQEEEKRKAEEARLKHEREMPTSDQIKQFKKVAKKKIELAEEKAFEEEML